MKLPTHTTLLLASFLWLIPYSAFSQRAEIPFNENWHFEGKSVSGTPISEDITLPHTWNAKDAQEGMVYYRGNGFYSKTFAADQAWKGKRVFIRFDGVNIKSKVVLNGKELGEHKGGYAAFIYEITDLLNFDAENQIEVAVNNEANLEVPPLVGDFNNYGGMYRPVNLLITETVCITPLDYASPGIYLKQSNVSKESASLEVLTKFSNESGLETNITYQTTIFDSEGNLLQQNSTQHSIPVGNSGQTHTYTIENPTLWHGKKQPYLYRVKVDIIQNGKIIDVKTEPLGFRFFHVDANEGFFLNGEPIDLRGVSRHQDRQDKGSAISQANHREDMAIMLEMGINALRLAHYQHAEIIYDMTDTAGLVVWAELPWVGGPGGFMGNSNGYENTEAFHTNAKQQLYELIRQNYNHPSILMWSIFNEIQSPDGAEPTDFIHELNDIVKAEDPYRLSVGASMLNPDKDPEIHDITDLIAWNRYFGWYYGEPADMGSFLDEVHANHPEYKIGISEYGAGGSIYQHSDALQSPNPMGSPHPEEWQSYYHEENLKIFDERPYVWGTFLWNMFDFGSHFRREGDHYGINDKGMVTYDRKTKKDAFYFYKANWSEKPVLHITSSRYIFRKEKTTQVKVYTNLENVKLTVNGEDFPTKSPENGIIIWEDIQLQQGNNGIFVEANNDAQTIKDECVWVIENEYGGMNLFLKIFDFLMVANRYIIGGLILAFLVWWRGIRRNRKAAKWKQVGLWTIFTIIMVVTLAILAMKTGIPLLMGN